MKDRCLCLLLSILFIFFVSGCSAKDSVETNESSVVVDETISTSNTKLFIEYDLLKIERLENSIENGFVMADFIVQNKSDSLTISNFNFKYLIDDGGTPIDEEFSTDVNDGLFVLEPRQKAELDLMEFIGNNINDDMRIFISSYSYDLEDKHYIVNVIEQNVIVSDITNQSNVSYGEKDIIRFEKSDLLQYRSIAFVNGSKSDIKTLDVSVGIYDKNDTLKKITTVSVVDLGDKPIGSNEKGVVEVEELLSEEHGYLLPVRYVYSIGAVDKDGYNSFDINLITEEAYGSKNTLVMDNSIDKSGEQLKKEIEPYISVLGKKITDTSFEGYKIEERVGSEWLHFNNSTLFGVSGTSTLVRDYDTLILTDFWFNTDNIDDETEVVLLKALELIYGEEYESEIENGKIKAEWNLEKYIVEYDAKYGSIHIDSDIE